MQLYKYAKSATLVNWQTLLALAIISMVVGAVFNNIGNQNPGSAVAILASIVSFVISIYFTVATTIAELRSVDRQKVSFTESLSQSGSYFFSMLLASLFVIVLLVGSLMLLIVPFFFVLPRITLFPYYLVEKKLGPIESVKASWEGTKGQSGKVWGIIGVNILFALLIITIIGIPFALYFLFMYSTALPLLYRWLGKTTASSPVQPSGPTLPVTPPATPAQ